VIDNDLKQKKKQPKVVRENRLIAETSTDFFYENYYRELCGTGGPLIFPRGPRDHNLKCRLIHHHDPYLSKKSKDPDFGTFKDYLKDILFQKLDHTR